MVRAAQLVGSALLVPEEWEYTAVASLSGASDLIAAGLTRIVERHGFLPAFFPLNMLMMKFTRKTTWKASITRSAVVASTRRFCIPGPASSGKCS